MKSFAVDVAVRQFSKKGEDIYGDAVKVSQTPDSTIIVMSDGLGSGVKANVLATLTVELASGLFQGDLSLHEIIETLIATLPVCKWRNIAYSTFSIVRIYDTGHVTVAEYDSPGLIYLREGNGAVPISTTERTIFDRTIRESYFKMNPGDMLVMYSDGILYAGVGEGLRMGWQEEGILEYVSEIVPTLSNGSKELADAIADRAIGFWANRPGDDGTVLCAKYRKARLATVLSGPPMDRGLVGRQIMDFLASPGAKIVCGGTTSHLVADYLNEELQLDERFLDTDLPPTGKIRGIDLVTEGILTLSRAAEYLKNGIPEDKADGATALLDQLLKADGIKFIVGMARNPAHQNTGLPDSIFLRRTVVEDLATLLNDMGKETELVYY
ncbi:MAG TPA: SpoIIE family protein phosphatase [Armatimonadota bacterium]|nr:SpoIIE family protein phosphatase [Armatimonadota bacterium]